MDKAPGPHRQARSFRLHARVSLVVLACGLATAAHGQDLAAARQLAVDRGCHNCHAEPSRRNVRSFADIAKAYERLRGKPGAEQAARDRMHHGGLLSHVAAHERLSEEEATLLVHWLFAGGG